VYIKDKIIFFCMIFVVASAFSQGQFCKPVKMLLLQTEKKFSGSSPLSIKANILATTNVVIAPDFYLTQLGFFCKQEIKFEKATKVPFRFRLGTVEGCDRLEGKYRREDPRP
jgi:hypothetical protein